MNVLTYDDFLNLKSYLVECAASEEGDVVS